VNFLRQHIRLALRDFGPIDQQLRYVKNVIKNYQNWKITMSKKILHKIIDEIGLLEVNTIIIQYLREKAERTEKESFKAKNMSERIDKAVMHDNIADDYLTLNKRIVNVGY
jgi:hypothetical protein